MPSYDPSGSKTFDYPRMKELYPNALRRAQSGCKNRRDEGDEGGNPSTNLDKLLTWMTQPD